MNSYSYVEVCMSEETFLIVKDLRKSYGEGGSYAQVLKGVSIKRQIDAS